ncbi:Oidioi.mRNA.OKI2018_I69.XSR.g14572.t1.cds [Oikopleura dioica]|uniref:Oidioi.mRNA.OKI2018_I69.XSR.g14572.t1.cds n=1 Tax=Oikopleura dioica TaxID=34765 RepID=A0ABN7SE88_OIKDI|nr:Oidioi.mRNA.OKI2018_I69.XSR.g14572.t1.cds [Oikopleura dioica]
MISRIFLRSGRRMQSVSPPKSGGQAGPLSWPAKVTGNPAPKKPAKKSGFFPSLRKNLLADQEKNLLKAEQNRWFPFLRKSQDESPSPSKTTYSVKTNQKDKEDDLVVW